MFNMEECNNQIRFEKKPLTWKFWQKKRYIVTLMAFIGFFNLYALRVNLSVAIVAMTENRTIHLDNGSIVYEQYFPWTSTDNGFILSSFFYGYVLTMIPGGIIAAKFGGTVILGLGILGTAILTILTPIVTTYGGIYAIIALRVGEGLFGGVTYPASHAVWARWAPPTERSRMVAIAFSGAYIGTTISMLICGILAENLGWESTFYVFGTIACIWWIGWIIFVRESPEHDKFITMDELNFIQKSLPNTIDVPKIKYPWKKIFTSTPLYAICFSSFCDSWGFVMLLTLLPTFLKDGLQYDLGNSGIFSAFPYIAVGILITIAGYLSDYCLVKRWLNITQIRKYFYCIAVIGQALFLVLAAILMHKIASLICIILAIGLDGIAVSSYAINPLDLAPQYASVLMAISNMCGTISAMISPIVTGYIIQTNSTTEWQLAFYVAAGVYLIGCIINWCWSSGELQSWAIQDETDK